MDAKPYETAFLFCLHHTGRASCESYGFEKAVSIQSGAVYAVHSLHKKRGIRTISRLIPLSFCVLFLPGAHSGSFPSPPARNGHSHRCSRFFSSWMRCGKSASARVSEQEGSVYHRRSFSHLLQFRIVPAGTHILSRRQHFIFRIPAPWLYGSCHPCHCIPSGTAGPAAGPAGRRPPH